MACRKSTAHYSLLGILGGIEGVHIVAIRPAHRAALLLVTMLVMSGCGKSLGKLNQLSASGAIHEDAPVKAHVSIEVAAPVNRVWTILTDAPSWPSWASQIDSVDSS